MALQPAALIQVGLKERVLEGFEDAHCALLGPLGHSFSKHWVINLLKDKQVCIDELCLTGLDLVVGLKDFDEVIDVIVLLSKVPHAVKIERFTVLTKKRID